jgi:tetratricopeptide (TPR) repeat protein
MIADGPLAPYRRAIVLTHAALSHLYIGDIGRARERVESALDLAATLPLEPSPGLADAWTALGRIHLSANDPQTAQKLLQQADAFWGRFDAANRDAGETALWLGRAYRALGRHRDADEALRRAASVLARSPLRSDRELAKKVSQNLS